ncbi:hypothetical protein AK812_SmicGene7340 [Symbiodinium microadriaticum]|uniref:Uncharacterized protein n=1 Tax=Symbiodinium microadriaticum TaxID=2951 RepID=A0A1Q9EP05_SYMMI|nr:hypothetical protein AK812_SmicGene7340 [Symbiodinium microadriaticum]
MGKGWKKQTPQQQPPPWRGSQGQWSIWQGAWRSPRSSQQPSWSDKEGQERSQFPAYDAAWKQAPAIAVVAEDRPAQAPGGRVGHVQHALNLARRVENKLAKLRTEQLQRSRSWEKYISDVKEAVARERSRHEASQTRISKEIQELEASQAAAYEQVTAVALEMQGQGGALGPLTVRYSENTGMDVDLGLEQRDATHLESSISDADLAAELRRIIDVVQTRKSGSQADGEGMREVPLPVPPESVSPLQEQLRAKRQEARRVMEPFGIPGKLHQHGLPPAPSTTPEQVPAARGIIQDDDEELGAASTLTASPGLGKLE